MKSINPSNLKEIATFQEDTDSEIDHKLEAAAKAFEKFRLLSLQERSKHMKKLGQFLKERKKEYAPTLTQEMGKPLAEAEAEIEKCAWVCEYYAENAAEFLQSEEISTDAAKSYVSYEPLGVILAVMPWNFPFWQVFRFAAPTLMAGNTAVLKHASNVQGSADLIVQLFKDAGFEEGVFQNLRIPSDKVDYVVKNEYIKGASVTGSEKAGSAVASLCGELIKPSVLELGGSNAFIVLKDADLSQVVKTAVKARMINNAQSCIAAKRFILEKPIAEEFIQLFVEEFRKLKMGDPMDSNTDVGPLARVDLAEDLEKQLNKSLEAGAKLLYGGKRKDAFFEPTVISEVRPGMPAFDEELFGPVAPMIIAENEDEAIQLANKSRFGLGVTIASRNIEKAEKLATKIEDGAVFINELVKSDPRLPFGGTKKSGYGRELSHLGIKEFVNAKTVYINK